MTEIKLPIVILIALVSAVSGGLVSYVAIPNTDPETKALLKRQVTLLEEEAKAREDAKERSKKFFDTSETPPTSGGQQMRPRW